MRKTLLRREFYAEKRLTSPHKERDKEEKESAPTCTLLVQEEGKKRFKLEPMEGKSDSS